LVDDPGTTLKPGAAATLTPADRDRLLAAVYARTYQERITGTTTCQNCNNLFDMDFNLSALLATLQPEDEPALAKKNGQGTYELPDGRHFRLPTGEDEFAVRHLSAEEAARELLRRCVIKGDPTADPATVQAAMKAVAPVLDLELDAQCPECEASQTIHFDIQSYLLSALKAEQPRLAQEVHRVATAYGWGLNEILGLARSQRRAYVTLIEAEMAKAS
jgi:hypothetical protein